MKLKRNFRTKGREREEKRDEMQKGEKGLSTCILQDEAGLSRRGASECAYPSAPSTPAKKDGPLFSSTLSDATGFLSGNFSRKSLPPDSIFIPPSFSI